MIKNYFTILFRNMLRNKLFTLINITGISVSLACCIILFLYTSRELSFDKHHGPYVYRITSIISQKDGTEFKLPTTSVPVGNAIQMNIPEIEYAGRAINGAVFGGKTLINYEDESFYVDNGYIVDSTLFNILVFDIVMGNREKPFPHTNAVVLERSWAETIFGNADPIGKMIRVNTDFGRSEFEITAIIENKSNLSHINPSFLLPSSHSSWNDFLNQQNTNWVGNNFVITYTKLRDGARYNETEKKINDLLLIHGGEQMKAMGLDKKMYLQPVREVHTATGYMVEVFQTTNPVFIRVLILIGILVLFLACVNYINLSTAQAGRRALEVGVRKVMGVSSRGLIIQFLAESLLIILLAAVLSLFLAQLALPYFNQLIDQPLEFSGRFFSELILFLTAFVVFTGLAAGFYPAFYLSSFKPAMVLKGRSGRERSGSAFLRKGLVVFQFVISIGLITSIIIISDQVSYIRNKELGFNADSKLVIPLNTGESADQYEVLREKFGSYADVRKISGADAIPGLTMLNDLLLYKQGQTMDDAIHIYNNHVDLGFLELLEIDLLSGSYFTGYNLDTTSSKIVITKAGLDMLGIPVENAPGEILYFDWEGRTLQYEIVGVTEDIHQFSLHQAIDPVMFEIRRGERYKYLVLDTQAEVLQPLLADLEKDWKEIIADTPFSYFTLNDQLMTQYESDFNTFNLIKYFAIIAVIISCLGLYAMSLFHAEKRIREIGIRKAFGAGINQILLMVSGDLTKLILIAYLISVPLSYYAMYKWLESFAYKISPGILNFLFAGMISLTIGILTISYQSWRAARTNPVETLREE
jgi:putative ABC transport system permease protein